MKQLLVFGLIVAALHGVLMRDAVAAPPDDVAAAKEHFRNGTKLYDLGKYLDAAGEYEKAFNLSERPAFLFNIGQAYRLANRPREAVAAYQGFLRRLPDAPQRAEVESQLQLLQRQVTETEARDAAAKAEADKQEEARRLAAGRDNEPRTADPATVVAPPPKKPVYKQWWLWTTVGIVAAGVGLGVGLSLTLGQRTRGSALAAPETFD